MKSCAKCHRTYPDEAGFCPADGAPLVFASQVPIAPSADDPRLGKLLCDRYEIRRVVADGGMGRVYEGIDKQTNTRVAVKVLHDEVSRDEVSLERFKREYEISHGLPHDHIVHVMDFQRDEQAGVWLLVMEFLDGEELRFVLKRDKCMAPERLIRMLSQTAIGLDGAHAKSFVHRDLKPDNLFLVGTREGDIVKILDFGSVKDKNKDAKKLTVLGTTIGSPFYMAPEQAQGLETLDARADVFALAAITYECAAGVVPFTGNNGPSILLAILTKDPEPVSSKGKAAPFPPPRELDDVLEVALAKNPAIRTPTVGALADAVGGAYGLIGDHRTWARIPQQDLARQIHEAQSKRPRIEAAADPFAAPDPFAPPRGPASVQHAGPASAMAGGGGMAVQVAQNVQMPPPQFVPTQQSAGGGGYDHRPSYHQPVDEPDMRVVPTSGSPPWLIPVIVGLVAIFVGGGIAYFFVR